MRCGVNFSGIFTRCFAGAAVISFLVSGCGDAQKSDGVLEVSAGLPPVAFLASRIGGEAATVSTMLPEGRSPHDYSPAPRDVQRAARSRIFLTTGMSFEKTLCRPLDGSRTTVCDATDGIKRIPMELACGHGHDHDHAGHHDHGHGHDALDPHVWLDSENLCRMAENICKAFCAADPRNAELYRANCAKLVGEIRSRHRQMAAQLAPYKGRCFYVYHPAFGYFARMFDLRQEAVELDGREISPARLAGLIRQAKQDRVAVIFVQPQFSPSAMRALKRELKVEIKTADPLRRDVLKNMQELASELEKAFAEYDSK